MRNIKRFFVGTYGTRTGFRTSRPAHGKYSRVGTYGTRYLGTFFRLQSECVFATHSWEATDCVKHCAVGISKLLSNALWFYEAVTGYGITYVPHNFFTHHARNKRSARVFLISAYDFDSCMLDLYFGTFQYASFRG